jgi:hypothetical protein
VPRAPTRLHRAGRAGAAGFRASRLRNDPNISAVSKLSRYFGQSPDKLELEDVRAFQVHLVSTGISWPALNQIVCALRFFTA